MKMWKRRSRGREKIKVRKTIVGKSIYKYYFIIITLKTKIDVEKVYLVSLVICVAVTLRL